MCLFWLVDRVVVFAGVGGGVDLVVGGVSVSGVACASGVVVCVSRFFNANIFFIISS